MTTDPSRADELLAHVPQGPVPASSGGERLLDLIKVMARLRGPGGCPWDAEQTHQTLARHLLEETHELLQAIDADDDGGMRDELGDLLLQVVFHAQMAADDDRWDVDDVAEGLIKKLIYRHPHVFGEVDVTGADEVLLNWERLKAAEKDTAPGVQDDIPAALPSLARAAKVQRRAAGRGLDRQTVRDALDVLRQEVDDLTATVGAPTEPDGRARDPDAVEARIGEVLFAIVAVARKAGLDAESALRRTTTGFAQRHERFVELAAARGIEVSSADEATLRALFEEASTTDDLGS